MGMDSTAEPEKIVEMIATSSGRSNADVKALIDQKKEKFSGLLTDSGAAFMIAKELGVSLNSEPTEAIKISSLKEGMNNIDVIARLKQAYAPKSFDKNGRQGKLQSLILLDDTGEIRATLWNKDVDKFSEMGIQKGTALKISNCAVTSYNNILQLNLNYNSSFAKDENVKLPEIEKNIMSITDLDSNMNDVNVKIEIKRVFPAKEFETEKGKGKVMNFIIGEGVNELRATAWNELCDEVENYSEGDKVFIEGAYTKEGRDG
ncbi:MAG: OB-fold nucleic acid binding domain-containing protein, partial [archaeon]|nr:OB-fold nucleic acid binding domain-containing protein [archaeon]